MEEPPEGKPVSITDDGQLKELTSKMPDVVPDAVAASLEQENQTQDAIKKAEKDFSDNKGRKFDPNIHAVDANGQPIMTPTGRFKRKLKLPEATTSMDTKIVDPLRVEAEKYADMFIVGGMGFVGDEFKPQEGEREGLVVAWHAVFQKYGIMPIHPALGIVVAHSLYVFRRYEKPRTQSILNKAFTGIRFFFINLWMKLTGKDYKVIPKEDNKK